LYPDGVSVGIPASHYRRRALVLMLAVPALLFALAVLLGLEMGLQDSDLLWIVQMGGAAAGSGVSLLGGGAMLLLAGRLSQRSQVRLDVARRVLRPARGAQPTSWDELARISVVRPNPLLKWWRLQAETRGGAVIPLRGSIAPGAGAAAEALARWCGELLGVEVTVGEGLAEQDALGVSPRMSAVLCWVPLQGIFLIASAYYLLRGHEHPFVRFCAKQSLAQFALSIPVVLLAVALGGIPLALVGPGAPRVLAAVWLGLLLVAFLVWNVGTRIVGCVRAHRGEVWVIPWLARFSRGWAPDEPPAWAAGQRGRSSEPGPA